MRLIYMIFEVGKLIAFPNCLCHESIYPNSRPILLKNKKNLIILSKDSFLIEDYK